MNEVKSPYKWVGTRPIRPDGIPKVTGTAKYGADFSLPGMLYGKILRSPHAHANIKSIDTSKAESLPGVQAVVTAVDFPGQDFPILGRNALRLISGILHVIFWRAKRRSMKDMPSPLWPRLTRRQPPEPAH